MPQVRAGLQSITLDALVERTPEGRQALELREYAQTLADAATAAINAFAAARAAALRAANLAGTESGGGRGAGGANAAEADQLSEDEAWDMRRLARSERLRAEQLLKNASEYILDNAQVCLCWNPLLPRSTAQ